MLGCEIADFLARKGKKVTVVEMLDTVMKEMNPSSVRGALLDILTLEEVTLRVETIVEEITAKGLIVRNKKGKKETILADSIVLAVGSHSNNELFQALKDKIPKVCLVGDLVKPRHILEAIDEGFRTALTI
jgi:pyruvate/2-oxoglutarate dehydrogenase complex dihydrolipoamide dehydrogenase (E3) component